MVLAVNSPRAGAAHAAGGDGACTAGRGRGTM